ncbi:MAG: cupin domain-containing protein [Spirochaetales bacterium]|nr:cupin domain-containing protein [Spirochaetales bacterium]
MIIRRDEMKSEIREAMRGGAGTVKITHLVPRESIKNGRLLCEVVLPPGAGIGEHEHRDETEYYLITGGEGLVCDNGEDLTVRAGDVVVTPHGGTHSIRNTGSADLTMTAVIITY